MGPGRTVLALVASPDTAAPLGRLAGQLARHEAGDVVALSVMALDGQEASARGAARTAAAAAEEAGASARARAVAHRSVAAAVRAERADADASLVLMGWRAPDDPGEFGGLVDQLVQDAEAPLLLVRPGSAPFQRTVVALSDDELLIPSDSDEESAAVASTPSDPETSAHDDSSTRADSSTLALTIARALVHGGNGQALVVRAGARRLGLPEDAGLLEGPIHHDPRPLEHVLAGLERPDDAVIVPVAPDAGTVARAARLPSVGTESWLLVAIGQRVRPHAPFAEALDATPVPDEAAQPPSSRMVIVEHGTSGHFEVVVTVTGVGLEADTTVAHRLGAVGTPGPVEPRASADHQWLEGSVVLEATSATAAVGAVVSAMDRASELHQAEITYHVRALPEQQ